LSDNDFSGSPATDTDIISAQHFSTGALETAGPGCYDVVAIARAAGFRMLVMSRINRSQRSCLPRVAGDVFCCLPLFTLVGRGRDLLSNRLGRSSSRCPARAISTNFRFLSRTTPVVRLGATAFTRHRDQARFSFGCRGEQLAGPVHTRSRNSVAGLVCKSRYPRSS